MDALSAADAPHICDLIQYLICTSKYLDPAICLVNQLHGSFLWEQCVSPSWSLRYEAWLWIQS